MEPLKTSFLLLTPRPNGSSLPDFVIQADGRASLSTRVEREILGVFRGSHK
jgi:hypothetical protein